MKILFYIITVFFGSLIQTVSGFGFGIFVMSFFPYLFPTASCAVISGMLSCVSSSVLAIKLRKKCNKKKLVVLLTGYFLFAFAAVVLSSVSPDIILKRVLGIVLVSLGVFFMLSTKK